MQIHKWIKELEKNDKQAEALYKPGNTVVIAGPGSGKTRVLNYKNNEATSRRNQGASRYCLLDLYQNDGKGNRTKALQPRYSRSTQYLCGYCSQFLSFTYRTPYAKLFGVKLPEPFRIAPKELIQNTQSLVLKAHVKGVNLYTAEQQFKILRQLKVGFALSGIGDSENYARAISDYEQRLIN